MSYFNRHNDFKNKLLLKALDRDFIAELADVIKGQASDPIIGYDWEQFPLRAHSAGLLYRQHLEEVPETELVEFKKVLLQFNGDEQLPDRIHSLGLRSGADFQEVRT